MGTNTTIGGFETLQLLSISPTPLPEEYVEDLLEKGLVEEVLPVEGPGIYCEPTEAGYRVLEDHGNVPYHQ